MNNNFMRQGQGNRNRNRNRNRHNNRGGSGGGGNSSNKVFDSNGPDVKVRGTAQTIAEKYMQLGRDAQSSGDNVAAESYYQHAEHYYRVWAANQPAGASLIMSRKLGEEDFEDEPQANEAGDDEGGEGQPMEGVQADAVEGSEQPQGEGPQASGEGQQRPFNNNRNQNGRERFKPRWQQRRERWQNQPEGGSDPASPLPQADTQPAAQIAEDGGQWEAPSFLQRPVPAPAPVSVAEEHPPEASSEPAPRRQRLRRDRAEPTPADDPTPAAE